MFWDLSSCCWEFSTGPNISKKYQHGKMEDKLYGSSELPDALFFACDFYFLKIEKEKENMPTEINE